MGQLILKMVRPKLLAATVLLLFTVLLAGSWYIRQSISRGYSLGLYEEAMRSYAARYGRLPATMAELIAEYRPENGFRLPDLQYPVPAYRPIDYSGIHPGGRYLVLVEAPNVKAFWHRYVVYWSPITGSGDIEV